MEIGTNELTRPFRIPRRKNSTQELKELSVEVNRARLITTTNSRSPLVAPGVTRTDAANCFNRIVPTAKRKAPQANYKSKKSNKQRSAGPAVLDEILGMMVNPQKDRQREPNKDAEEVVRSDNYRSESKQDLLTQDDMTKRAIDDSMCYAFLTREGLMERLLGLKMLIGRIDSHVTLGCMSGDPSRKKCACAADQQSSGQKEQQQSSQPISAFEDRKGPRTPPGSPGLVDNSSVISSRGVGSASPTSPPPPPPISDQKSCRESDPTRYIIADVAGVTKLSANHLSEFLGKDLEDAVKQVDRSVLLNALKDAIKKVGQREEQAPDSKNVPPENKESPLEHELVEPISTAVEMDIEGSSSTEKSGQVLPPPPPAPRTPPRLFSGGVRNFLNSATAQSNASCILPTPPPPPPLAQAVSFHPQVSCSPRATKDLRGSLSPTEAHHAPSSRNSNFEAQASSAVHSVASTLPVLNHPASSTGIIEPMLRYPSSSRSVADQTLKDNAIGHIRFPPPSISPFSFNRLSTLSCHPHPISASIRASRIDFPVLPRVHRFDHPPQQLSAASSQVHNASLSIQSPVNTDGNLNSNMRPTLPNFHHSFSKNEDPMLKNDESNMIQTSSAPEKRLNVGCLRFQPQLRPGTPLMDDSLPGSALQSVKCSPKIGNVTPSSQTVIKTLLNALAIPQNGQDSSSNDRFEAVQRTTDFALSRNRPMTTALSQTNSFEDVLSTVSLQTGGRACSQSSISVVGPNEYQSPDVFKKSVNSVFVSAETQYEEDEPEVMDFSWPPANFDEVERQHSNNVSASKSFNSNRSRQVSQRSREGPSMYDSGSQTKIPVESVSNLFEGGRSGNGIPFDYRGAVSLSSVCRPSSFPIMQRKYPLAYFPPQRSIPPLRQVVHERFLRPPYRRY